jgi:(2R)-3-sulfolactate dehydrogenase (NADP+)
VARYQGALAGSDLFYSRIETLIGMMLGDEGVQLPGERRRAIAANATEAGIMVPDALYRQIVELGEARM